MDIGHRYTHGVGSHLGIYGVAALTYLCLSGLDLHGAVLVKYHTAGRGLERDRPDAGVVPIERHAHAAAEVPCLRLGVLFIQALEVRGLCPGLHAYAEAVAPVAVFRKFVCVSLWHGYLAPELDRAHAQGASYVVYMRLAREGGLRYAVAAHGSGRRQVCKRRPGVAFQIRAGVDLWEGVHALGADSVTVRGVAALI